MTAQASGDSSLEALRPLVGEWLMVPTFTGLPPIESGARVTFEWMPGERFLIQRWEVPIPEAPDGIAVIGPDPERAGGYLQHYFDTRGVARVYKMSLKDGVWTLWRDTADFSPFDFAQRYTGTFSADGRRLADLRGADNPAAGGRARPGRRGDAAVRRGRAAASAALRRRPRPATPH
jgi:hypothetical protein